MSTMELNKGTLYPITADEKDSEAFVKSLGYEEISLYLDDNWEDMEYIGGILYKVVKEVDGEEDCGWICALEKNEDGNINFLTYHYNGTDGPLTEYLEDFVKSDEPKLWRC